MYIFLQLTASYVNVKYMDQGYKKISLTNLDYISKFCTFLINIVSNSANKKNSL